MSSCPSCQWRFSLSNSYKEAELSEELTHLKRPQCWEILKAGAELNDKRKRLLMASLTRWTWVWASSMSWWWTGKPGVLQCMGSQRVGHDWIELNTDLAPLWSHGYGRDCLNNALGKSAAPPGSYLKTSSVPVLGCHMLALNYTVTTQ